MTSPAKAANDLHHIVVAGGGAAGLELVTKLGDTLGRRRLAKITLVERSRTHLWKPLLHSVAAGSLRRSEHELNYLAQAHWHHFNYTYGEVIGLDRDVKQLKLAPMLDEEGRQITPSATVPYDTLIIAIGSVTNDFGTPGAAKVRSAAGKIRNRQIASTAGWSMPAFAPMRRPNRSGRGSCTWRSSALAPPGRNSRPSFTAR